MRAPLAIISAFGCAIAVACFSERGAGPYAVKAIGELPTVPVAAAIANAIADAIGVRMRQLPITAERVYEALKDQPRT